MSGMAFIVIEQRRCKGCALCTTVCPSGLFSMGSELNAQGNPVALFSDPQGKCTGCAMCARMCPDTAISVYRQ